MGFTIGDRIKDRIGDRSIGDRSIGDEIGDGYFDTRLKEPTLSRLQCRVATIDTTCSILI